MGKMYSQSDLQSQNEKMEKIISQTRIEIEFYNTNMIRRQIQSHVQHRLNQYPAVALVGPRQCWKTTLAQMIGGIYFDL